MYVVGGIKSALLPFYDGRGHPGRGRGRLRLRVSPFKADSSC